MNKNVIDDAYWSDEHPPILDEVTYKDFMTSINPNDLPYRDYSPLIPFVRFVEMKQNTIKFFVPNKYNGWNTYIRFGTQEEYKGWLRDTALNNVDLARLMLWSSNVYFFCGCAAFLFWGNSYVLTQLGAAIVPEDRFPKIRNPRLKGNGLCKHGIRSFKVLPFHLGDMAKAIKNQRSRL